MSTLRTLGHFLAARRRWRDLSGERLVAFQDARARATVRFVAARSGFYREHWAGHDLERWGALPTVDKAAMMGHFDRFNTVGVRKDAALEVALRAERDRNFSPTIGPLTVGLSSGTSGHRGVFLVSPAEADAWAGVILARALPRLRPQGERVAFFLRSNSNLYERVRRRRWLQFRYFDLMTPMPEIVQALGDYAPTIVVAPPSMLAMLGRELAAGRLRVRPDKLISVAEVLEPQDRARLEAQFQCSVGQIYQATEGLLGVSCAHGTLHLQEDIVAVQLEPVPGDGVASDGSRFTPVITDLWRRTQPIVRYRLNDVLRLAQGPCACGSDWRPIEAVEGRSDDVLEFHSQHGEPRAFFPDTIRRAVLLASPSILEYEAIQAETGHLRVHLEVAPGGEADAERGLRETILEMTARHGCRPASLEVVFGLPERAANVKRRRVRRLTPTQT